jgi:hypothetical protein
VFQGFMLRAKAVAGVALLGRGHPHVADDAQRLRAPGHHMLPPGANGLTVLPVGGLVAVSQGMSGWL